MRCEAIGLTVPMLHNVPRITCLLALASSLRHASVYSQATNFSRTTCAALVLKLLLLQATSLEALPTDILNQILYQLDAQQQARLRLTCRLLAGAVSSQLSHASTALHISRAAALSLQQAFPRLVSLALIDPLSTHRLPLLTRLISVSLALSKRSLSSSMTVDLAPLEDLPSLHTLHLENVQMQRLAPGPACIMAALTQLKALRLVDCTVAGPGSAKPQDLAALPGVTKLQVVDQSPAGLVRLTGLHNMQQVCGLTCWVPDHDMEHSRMFSQAV